MKLFNTLTKSKDEFEISDNTVRMYACGPTVYNYFHIGNARCFVLFDMLRRYLEYRGNKVIFVQNFTDVDDKLIKKAREESSTVPEIAERYIKEYFTDAKGLGINAASVHPRATENIDAIISIIETLIEKGNAYEVDGDVYFSAESFKEYGKLSHYNPDDLKAGARIDVNEDKRHPFDFALWKSKKEPDEISWDSPWGQGRPGWHIECSAMAGRYLGKSIDIHCGGQDLIFPHHENEIAQSECANGCMFSRFWLHNGYINVDGEKMAKSKGNFFMVRDAAKEYGYQPIRYFLLASHYRSPINFSAKTLVEAQTALERLHNCAGNMEFLISSAPDGELTESEKASLAVLADKKQAFIDSMDDDFNTAGAIGILFEMTKEINTYISSHSDASKAYLTAAHDIHGELCDLLGLSKPKTADDDDALIESLIAERTQAKKDKNFALADEIRQKLSDMGVTLEDTRQGVKWKKN